LFKLGSSKVLFFSHGFRATRRRLIRLVKACSEILDMLEEFVHGGLKFNGVETIINPIARLLTHARTNNWPIIYSNDAHIENVDHEFDVWGAHALAGSRDAEVIEELPPQKGDFIIPKRRYSGFFATDLDALLRELKIDTLILTGLHTHICVRHTAADAFFRGYKLEIPADCMNSFTEKEHLEGLEYLKQIYNATITSTEELLKTS